MPNIAKRNTGDIVRARDVNITEQGDIFYCATPDCEAKLTIIKVGNIEEAYFRRLPSSPHHISAKCVRCGLQFDTTRYDEKLFNKDNAFLWLFNQPISRPNDPTGTDHTKVGGKRQAIRSLKSIYNMCVTRDKSDFYNGFKIGSFFADEENYKIYDGNLEGYVIVECSFYKKVYDESALLFNYPTNFKKPHNIIKLSFDKEDICWKYYHKYKGCHHTEPIAIAGKWIKNIGNSDYQATCQFYSDRQIYFIK